VTRVLVEVGVPAATFLLMMLVGLELTAADFQRVALYPGTVAVVTLGQILFLPLLASSLIVALAPSPPIAAGMILMAACPPAILSSVYVSLARADTALAVTLNAVFDLVSLVSLPLVLAAGFALFVADQSGVRPPVRLMMGQLLLLVLLPTAGGMTLRRRFPRAVQEHRSRLQGLSLLVLMALMGGFLWSQAPFLAASVWRTAVAAALFTGLALAGGWALGWALRAGSAARLAVAFVFASRSVAIATVVAVSLLHRPDFLLFGTLFFLTHSVLMLAVVAVMRLHSSRVTRALLPAGRAARGGLSS
jgi:BASS family bile acid:Na+ symporter